MSTPSTGYAVTPNVSEFERTTQNIINKYAGHLSNIDTKWTVVRNEYGDIVAYLPNWHIRFKDNSEIVVMLEKGKLTNARQH